MRKRSSVYILLIFIILGSCLTGSENENLSPVFDDYIVLMVIDESSIDNGIEPNDFSETDVNDQIAAVGQRDQLKYFKENVGKTIDLYTGQVGDEGWFALKNIPNRWVNAGPTGNGAQNYLTPGPGLGAPNIDNDRDVLLDEIPKVTPLRATALKMLVGVKVLAVVYDSDISVNYSPLEGNLQGANLGLVAFEVLDVKKRVGGSDADLPVVTIKILNVEALSQFGVVLYSNAPEPQSSSEPEDVNPPDTVEIPVFVLAN
ncbi:hypothetical protein M3O96_07020 [Aquiflexum sp. TKW24L]|uniref:hypothetical protein n=1 Tax=Aquiflexum sp. TKW24L TaxID=2942212 RepID=UPI0020C16CC5|nr:hypothetical protein [Aquiflexum sp. TKW24L]MCL6258829.1 hypothetical protein [Aquiflexum sp. TKW24L]